MHLAQTMEQSQEEASHGQSDGANMLLGLKVQAMTGPEAAAGLQAIAASAPAAKASAKQTLAIGDHIMFKDYITRANVYSQVMSISNDEPFFGEDEWQVYTAAGDILGIWHQVWKLSPEDGVPKKQGKQERVILDKDSLDIGTQVYSVTCDRSRRTKSSR